MKLLSAVRMLLPSYRDERRQATVLDVLDEHSQGLTAHELQLATGQNTNALRLALLRLCESGQLRTWVVPPRIPGSLPQRFYALPRRPR
jgi:hypothetical protein